ncbi:MAG: hypothetical protein E7166_03440 [Firmicutes bacterium]|nr:hypothetical protein [Bacillota bacterium]
MKESFWGYLIIILGVLTLSVILLFNDVTNTNDQNYYLVKEVTEAAMIDAIDIAYYRQTGILAINKDKFAENFIRRYAESASAGKTYNIKIYDVVEQPPKVSLSVSSKSNVFNFTGTAETFDIINKIDAILESREQAED